MLARARTGQDHTDVLVHNEHFYNQKSIFLSDDLRVKCPNLSQVL